MSFRSRGLPGLRTSRKKPDKSQHRTWRRVLVTSAVVLSLATALIAYTSVQLSAVPEPAVPVQAKLARQVYQEATRESLHPFAGAPELTPWKWQGEYSLPQQGFLQARSAILISVQTGEILYEKNADELIPPASMTKLVALYTAFRAIEAGETSPENRVAIPEEAWARNIPPGSSLMFLGPGQTVTLDEILTGMAVVSGNDAAIALAHHISGSVPAFVDRMNREMRRIGLRDTVFTEPSGLSEYNLTTAREFAGFALRYIREFPGALERYHSKQEFSYPARENLLPGNDERTIRQRATNNLLASLPGCDGLKTGFIHESGFNVCLTAERDGIRYLAVLMGGPGNTIREGVKIREADGKAVFEWVFANRELRPTIECVPVPLTVWGGETHGLWAIPAESGSLVVPAGVTLESRTLVPRWITAPVRAGDQTGLVRYYADDVMVYELPLIADRNTGTAALPRRLLDSAASFAAKLLLSSGRRSESGYLP